MARGPTVSDWPQEKGPRVILILVCTSHFAPGIRFGLRAYRLLFSSLFSFFPGYVVRQVREKGGERDASKRYAHN